MKHTKSILSAVFFTVIALVTFTACHNKKCHKEDGKCEKTASCCKDEKCCDKCSDSCTVENKCCEKCKVGEEKSCCKKGDKDCGKDSATCAKTEKKECCKKDSTKHE